MRNLKLTLDLVLTVVAFLSCAAFLAITDAAALGVVGGYAFMAATLLLGAAAAFEILRLPLLIAAHWAIIFGLGAGIGVMSLSVAGQPMLLAVVTGLATYVLAMRRWRRYAENKGVKATEEAVVSTVRPDPVGKLEDGMPTSGVRQRIEPRFD